MRKRLSTVAVFTAVPLMAGGALTTAAGVSSAAPAQPAAVSAATAGSAAPGTPSAATARALRVATRSLPSAERTRQYRTVLSRVGGTSPVRWSVTAGALPAGLTLSRRGLIAGVPKRSGAAQFSVTVRDARGARASRALTLVVAPRGGVVLTETSVGPVKFPANRASGAQLRRTFGHPSSAWDGAGCPLNDPSTAGHSLTWGDLTVSGEGASAAAVKFTTWTLNGMRVPARLSLPYKVGIGTTLSTLRARVPQVSVIKDELFSPGDYLARKGGMMWWVGKKSLKVFHIGANVTICD